MKQRSSGYLSLLLHAHLPFVRHPESSDFLEERWFFEAMTECYLPLLMVMDRLHREGVDYRLNWSLTPTLLSMLDDELLRDRYQVYLQRQIELAEKETYRLRGDPDLLELADFYYDRLRILRSYYEDVLGRDLVGAFRKKQDEGSIEILASAATHAYLPLLETVPSSLHAQIQIGVDTYRAAFDRDPEGIWLPECGYLPGMDKYLAEVGLRYFCVEAHGVLNGSSRAHYGVYAPVLCPTGVAAFARDPECSRQVWSREEGFPGDPVHRDFYRDIGFDLPIEYIGPFLGPDRMRTRTGIKYHKITGPGDEKEIYDRGAALRRSAEQAELFVEWRRRQIAFLRSTMDRKPLVLAPYDAELFGHWWYEGPEWLHRVLELLHADSSGLKTTTFSEYLAEYPRHQISVPSASSWGEQGYSDVWLNASNEWLPPRIFEAARDMESLAVGVSGASGLQRRALNQAARELLLAQASDWPFILRSGTSTGYAHRRIVEHLDAFHQLSGDIRVDRIDEKFLADLEQRNNLFQNIDYEVYSERLESPVADSSREPKHVVFLVAEMAPLVKVGGLADVAGALPGALAERGLNVTILLPAYGTIDRNLHDIHPYMDGLLAPLGNESISFSLLECRAAPPGVRILLVEHYEFFDREGVYVDPQTKEEYPDNALRFTFFTRAALESLRALGDPVDIVHSHDHQTALASAYIKMHYRDDPVLGESGTVYTLHNLGYQGVHPPEILDAAGIGREQCYPGSFFEYYGKVNFMKVGICFADKVSTVSETYAEEICNDEIQSAGLAPVIQGRAEDLVGIVNGIDPGEWGPLKDSHTAAPFSADDLSGKRLCKKAILEEAGMDASDLDTALIGMVTRLVDQKGLDLVEAIFDRLMGRKVNFVVLGTGLPKYEKFFQDAALQYPGRVGAMITFNNGVAHRIEAGADMFLMPSLYEPCGLNQLYSLRYGTVPVVRATGGLADTVPDADSYEDGLGFSFHDYGEGAFLETITRALRAFEDRGRWKEIMRRGMNRDLSWGVSADRYVELYSSAIAARVE